MSQEIQDLSGNPLRKIVQALAVKYRSQFGEMPFPKEPDAEFHIWRVHMSNPL
ncbi:hypothetical protein EWM64_g8228 [Hericium alpestre]|uniref:Uncharacterized protein n=1 Tax=Hericium alpestre TaxID=135208 RepID=A0A4Y9ZMD6_9AGAM|nr:hypothetical protein EWM64_g8228 [Hericium alpestre]